MSSETMAAISSAICRTSVVIVFFQKLKNDENWENANW